LFNGDHLAGPHKIEGDKKAPAGVFNLLFSFGYQHSAPATRLPYRPISPETVTVDDPRSRYYNQMLETTGVRHPDWRSAEKMRLTDDRYKWGIFVGHNLPPVPGAGSAIFLHVWKNSATTTVGCTAMPEKALVDLLHWLDPAKHPLLIQLPSPVYHQLEKAEKLPHLSSMGG
jgi:D-alanyl-D-alanine dipeptidase